MWQRGKYWHEADPDDLLDWEAWRRRGQQPGRISGSKWQRELAALRLLYEWAEKKGHIARSPVLVHAVRMRNGSTVMAADQAPRDVRCSDVKWVTPRTYRLWLEVGLLGYDTSGQPDPSWRGRNDGRNAAFTDLLFSSGLRLREGGCLLTPEVPDVAAGHCYHEGSVAGAVAKRRERMFYASATALRRVAGYIATTRADAVRRARKRRRGGAAPRCRARYSTGSSTWAGHPSGSGKSTARSRGRTSTPSSSPGATSTPRSWPGSRHPRRPAARYSPAAARFAEGIAADYPDDMTGVPDPLDLIAVRYPRGPPGSPWQATPAGSSRSRQRPRHWASETRGVDARHHLLDVDETAPLRPDSEAAYCAAKAEAEAIVLEASAPGLATVSIRPRFVWGPDSILINGLVAAAKAGQFAWIDGGRHSTDVTFVDNAVAGLMLGWQRGRAGQAYFVTDQHRVILRDFLDTMFDIYGVDTPIPELDGETAAREIPVPERWFLEQPCILRTGKAVAELGYEPIVGQAAGLDAVRDWAALSRA